MNNKNIVGWGGCISGMSALIVSIINCLNSKATGYQITAAFCTFMLIIILIMGFAFYKIFEKLLTEARENIEDARKNTNEARENAKNAQDGYERLFKTARETIKEERANSPYRPTPIRNETEA